ncbi:hypothetical protein GUJ93_ZPchr0012g20602 [Zizania palustris]|uniref:Uncharacterized protein n=1 Tax=Zizania palustris TaxID=103762 RepID=A0A8J5WPL5_ZIZPA|nr:hypothetical protein GUJ93_ZPchr0012g20602 [Zizania palustris]
MVSQRPIAPPPRRPRFLPAGRPTEHSELCCRRQPLKTCHATSKYLKTIVGFGGVANDRKEESKNHEMSIFSWEEFLIMGGDHHFNP